MFYKLWFKRVATITNEGKNWKVMLFKPAFAVGTPLIIE